jgi:hypothetical protein
MIEGNVTESYSRIIDLVERNVSSVDMISETLNLHPEETRSILDHLSKEGRLHGHLTEDGSRFFKTDIKGSDASPIEMMDNLDSHSTNSRLGLYVMTLGFAVYIIGNILVRVGGEESMLWGIGGAVTLAGPIIIILGLFFASQLASSDRMDRPRA